MRLKIEHHHSIFIANQWALVFLAFVSLGLGWYARYIPGVANCNLLMAHFIGAGIALWLGLSVLSARLKFVTIARRLD